MSVRSGNKIFCFLLFLFISSAGHLFSQSGQSAGLEFGAAPPGERWKITTRWDYRVRVDGKYLGYANRELREVFNRQEELPTGWLISGDARILGATKKDGYPVAARLEGTESIQFVLDKNGSVLDAGDNYPRLRGFPTFPDGEIHPGDIWEAPLDVLVRGPNDEKAVLPQTASYRYVGVKPYLDREAHYFEVNWALRYRGFDPEISTFLTQVEGSHRVSLVVDVATGAPIMARDNLQETWRWADNQVEERDGFALIFWTGVPPLDKGGIRREFEDRFPGVVTVVSGSDTPDDNTELDESGKNDNWISELDESVSSGDIFVTETEKGFSVTLMNLHFQPDLAKLLPEDRPLLDILADILSGIPDRTVLIRGHTADLGRPDDQYKLSEERAGTVADELKTRGIDPRRLLYEGVGADEPLASNDTEDGRRQNRRVEFLILED